MSRLKLLLGSLALTSALSGCAAHAATRTPVKPVPGHIVVDRAAVRAKLAARRAEVVERFLAYREGRVYPINNLPAGGTRHVWIDDWGNLCAAATLISLDWGRDAAIRVGHEDRELRLAVIKKGPVADWILTSGLTRHELVAIQLPGDDIMMRGRNQEIERMHRTYVDVERQLRSLWDANLELAVDELMKRPDLARDLLNDKVAGPGAYGVGDPIAMPEPPSAPVAPAPEPMPAVEPAA